MKDLDKDNGHEWKINLNPRTVAIIAMGLMIIFLPGCVLKPKTGDLLKANQKVTTAYCVFEKGKTIILGQKQPDVAEGQAGVIPNSGGFDVQGCLGGLDRSTIMWDFDRVQK
jgi:hypothetical protein